jgi:DNA polymerase (family 10)
VPKADTQEIARLLREYAQRSALRGGKPYRAKAYSRAADSLAALAVPIEGLIDEGRLTEIPGVGKAIADIISKLHRTGSHPSVEKLRKEVPARVLEMLSVPGLRPGKALRLYKDLGITSLAELEAAANDDLIKKAKGLGAALQTKILQNLGIAKSGRGRLHLHSAAALLEHAQESLRKSRPELKRLTVAGDLRRGCELVGDLAIVAEAPGSGSEPDVIDSAGLQVHLADRPIPSTSGLSCCTPQARRPIWSSCGRSLKRSGCGSNRTGCTRDPAWSLGPKRTFTGRSGFASSSPNCGRDAAKSSAR